MSKVKRKILSSLLMTAFVYLPYSCSTTRPKKEEVSSVKQHQELSEHNVGEEFLGKEEYVDEIASDELSYNQTIGGGPIKIIDFHRSPSAITVDESGVHFYQVKPFDTLMLISHQVYGDYSRWKELIPLNRQHLSSEFKIIGRPRIRFVGTPYDWEPPMGKPYFIKWGDSLSKISLKVYGTMDRWRDISENNPRQIKDPNLIFAGFHLYYPTQSNLSLIH